MKSEVNIGDNRLEMVRIFDAPRDRVFEAWKQVDQVQQWWGCQMTTKVESEINFQMGGSFTHRMQIEGAGECLYTGTYEEIIEPEKIAYHAEFGGHIAVTVEFIDQGDQTKLILTQEGFPDQDVCEIVSEGFTAAFDKLNQMLAGQAA